MKLLQRTTKCVLKLYFEAMKVFTGFGLLANQKFVGVCMQHFIGIKWRQFIDLCALLFLLAAFKIYIIKQIKKPKPCIAL